jgi:hypothetical protein
MSRDVETMPPAQNTVAAISPIFGMPGSQQGNGDMFHVHEKARLNLEGLGARLAGTLGLVGLYSTESADEEYQPDPQQNGRVIALVRMLPMPTGKTVADYPSGCLEYKTSGRTLKKVDKWPIGWPSELVYLQLHGAPVLRDLVYQALHISRYSDFAGQFLQGSIDLRRWPALGRLLMQEIRLRVAADPARQILPF